MSVNAIIYVFGFVSVASALRYFLWPVFGPKLTVRFKGGQPMARIIPRRKALVMLSAREIELARRGYKAQCAPYAVGRTDLANLESVIGENAIFCYFRQLAARLNLRNTLKTLEELVKFTEQVTNTLVSQEKMLETLYELYGYLPDDVPKATKRLIEQKVGRRWADADFDDEEAHYERGYKRDQWAMEIEQRPQTKAIAALEKRASKEQLLTSIHVSKAERKSAAPKKPQPRKLSRTEQASRNMRACQGELAEADEAFADDPEECERIKTRIREKYREMNNELFK